MSGLPVLDFDRCYDAVVSRDARFDGWFIVGVTSTGIYCRPSCPTPIRPKPVNVRFYSTAAAAQRAGLRACKRCRPDATPGSPAWNARADLVGRAVRYIGDGIVDREGVGGLARRLGVSTRHLQRLLNAELGAGPLALARAGRAQTARILIETTRLPFADIAHAAGFASVRQFNATVRQVFGAAPSDLRRGREPEATAGGGHIILRLPFRQPAAFDDLLSWLVARAVPGVARSGADPGEPPGRPHGYQRTLRLPRGGGRVTLAPAPDHVRCELELAELADLPTAVARCRRLLDLDADPLAIAAVLGRDPSLAPLVEARPGLRVPGTVDGAETALVAVLGQQIAVPAARTLAGSLVERLGERLDTLAGTPRAGGGTADDGPTAGAGEPPDRLFPSAEAVAAADLSFLGMPERRRRALGGMAEALARGDLVLEPGADRAEVRQRLLALPGIGPWTADYILLRALGHPDIALVDDLAVRQGAALAGLPRPAGRSRRPRPVLEPWASYATHHLWALRAERQGPVRAVPHPNRPTGPRRPADRTTDPIDRRAGARP